MQINRDRLAGTACSAIAQIYIGIDAAHHAHLEAEVRKTAGRYR
jgi:hypothetical protein